MQRLLSEKKFMASAGACRGMSSRKTDSWLVLKPNVELLDYVVMREVCLGNDVNDAFGRIDFANYKMYDHLSGTKYGALGERHGTAMKHAQLVDFLTSDLSQRGAAWQPN